MAEKTTAIEKLPTGKLYKKLFIFGLKISLIHLFLIFSFLFNKGHSDIVFLLAPLSFICWGGCPDLFIIFIFLLSSIFAGLIFSIIYYFYISFKKTNKIYKKAILFGLTTTITYPFLIFGIIFWGYRPVFLLGPFAFFYDDNRASFLFLIFLASIFAGLVLGIIYYVITKKRSIQS